MVATTCPLESRIITPMLEGLPSSEGLHPHLSCGSQVGEGFKRRLRSLEELLLRLRLCIF